MSLCSRHHGTCQGAPICDSSSPQASFSATRPSYGKVHQTRKSTKIVITIVWLFTAPRAVMEGRGKDVGFPVSPTIPAFWCGLALPLFWVDRLGFYFLHKLFERIDTLDYVLMLCFISSCCLCFVPTLLAHATLGVSL